MAVRRGRMGPRGADLRAATLASWAGVSVRQLNRIFRDHLGEPPGRAVRRIRLEVAARLLVATDLPLAQVARRCAFTSAETMRHAFVQRYGMNPSDFRATQRRAATFDPHGNPGPSGTLEESRDHRRSDRSTGPSCGGAPGTARYAG